MSAGAHLSLTEHYDPARAYEIVGVVKEAHYGAAVRDVIRLVLTEGATLVLAGLALGLIAAFWATRLLRSLLFGVMPTDPWTFAAVSVLVAAVACLATCLPARRAAQVDPVTALRHQ